MTTTIQIDDETKKKLFRIKLRLEEQKGEAITYNDLIEYVFLHIDFIYIFGCVIVSSYIAVDYLLNNG